jgi:UDP-2,4-diacetamido-2,4,6-trideoxy-beta-L-altropyranose hydrolase
LSKWLQAFELTPNPLNPFNPWLNKDLSRTLIIRADASARIGTGHMMRCLALSQAWRRSGGSIIFVSAESTDALEARLAEEGIQSVRTSVTPGSSQDAIDTAQIARSQKATWIVADSYNFGVDFQRRIQAEGLRLLFIDDYGHAGEYVADLILNQNLAADANLYAQREPHTQLLLGPRYALLRDEFRRWRNWHREIPAIARKVLVTLGGSDPNNMTIKVVHALQQLPHVEAKIVVGGSNPHIQPLRSSIASHQSTIELLVNAKNMPELMAWADMAVAAGGSTTWELAFMGLPTVVMVLAENQAASAQRLHDVGAVFSVGRADECVPEVLANVLNDLMQDALRRRIQSECGRMLVDGCGVERVTEVISRDPGSIGRMKVI